MNVLLLAYHYPPDRAVGSLRPEKVASAFHRAGHTVTVLTAAIPGERPGIRSAEPGIRVHTVAAWRHPREFYLAAKNFWNRSTTKTQGSHPVASNEHSGPVRSAWWKRWIASLYWMPDDRQGFVPPAIRYAMSVRDDIDLIYTTAPPSSVHLAGLCINSITGIRWVAEFRDPWTKSPWKPAHVRSALSDWLERQSERLCLRRADFVVCATHGIARGFHDTQPSARYIVALNGIDQIVTRAVDRRSQARRLILHTGTLYMSRDPRPFLDALSHLNRRLPRLNGHLDVRFVGNAVSFGGISVQNEIDRRNLQDIVTILPWIPHDHVARLMDSAAVLLLLAEGQPDQVPNKLYEYLGTGLPILAYADQGGEAEAMLKAVGGHYLLSGRPCAEQADLISQAVGMSPRNVEIPSKAILEQWTTASQMDELVRKILGES